MIKRISHVSPIQLGTVLAVLYGTLALVIFVPLFLIIGLIASHLPQTGNQQPMPAIGMIGAAVIAPIFTPFSASSAG